MSYSLDNLQNMIVRLSTIKKYNKNTEWLFEKLQEEFKELESAVMLDASPEDISEECADIVIVLTQIQNNECKGISFSESIYNKTVDNFTKKKKTKDETTGKIVRR